LTVFFCFINKTGYSLETKEKIYTVIYSLILLLTCNFVGKEQVFVYQTVKLYTFELACCLFLSVEDSDQISKLSLQFDAFLKGIVGFSLNIPGTRFHRAKKAADEIRKEIKMIVEKRKVDLEEKRASLTQDLLSHMLATSDPSGRFMTEKEILDNILLLLFAGHDTARSVLTLVMRYLGQLPQVYEHVLKGW